MVRRPLRPAGHVDAGAPDAPTVGLADGTRLRVSGDPSPEEIAAIVVALDAATDSDPAAQTPRTGWQRAARLEALGRSLLPWTNRLRRR